MMSHVFFYSFIRPIAWILVKCVHTTANYVLKSRMHINKRQLTKKRFLNSSTKFWKNLFFKVRFFFFNFKCHLILLIFCGTFKSDNLHIIFQNLAVQFFPFLILSDIRWIQLVASKSYMKIDLKSSSLYLLFATWKEEKNCLFLLATSNHFRDNGLPPQPRPKVLSFLWTELLSLKKKFRILPSVSLSPSRFAAPTIARPLSLSPAAPSLR